MSRCISSRGEYSEHTFLHPKAAARGEDRFTCTLCGDFDEWAAMEALLAAEAIAEAAREYVRIRRAHLDHGPLLSARKADARAVCRREGHQWDCPAGALHDHNFCWRCEAHR